MTRRISYAVPVWQSSLFFMPASNLLLLFSSGLEFRTYVLVNDSQCKGTTVYIANTQYNFIITASVLFYEDGYAFKVGV